MSGSARSVAVVLTRSSLLQVGPGLLHPHRSIQIGQYKLQWPGYCSTVQRIASVQCCDSSFCQLRYTVSGGCDTSSLRRIASIDIDGRPRFAHASSSGAAYLRHLQSAERGPLLLNQAAPITGWAKNVSHIIFLSATLPNANRVVGYLMTALLRVYQPYESDSETLWKSFENRLAFGKVTGKRIGLTFMAHPADVYRPH